MTVYLIIGLVVAYLLGSLPTSVWIGKLFFHVDVRKSGSGNAGATNTIRVLGWKAGLPVLIIDVFKGWLAVHIANFFFTDILSADDLLLFKVTLSAAAVLGHIFPVYIGFKGGRGVATLLGIGIALFPVTIWYSLGVFIIILLVFRIVSLGSILAAFSLPFFVFFVTPNEVYYLQYLSIAIAVFIPLTHWSNIKRLLNGEEKQFRFKKDK